MLLRRVGSDQRMLLWFIASVLRHASPTLDPMVSDAWLLSVSKVLPSCFDIVCLLLPRRLAFVILFINSFSCHGSIDRVVMVVVISNAVVAR